MVVAALGVLTGVLTACGSSPQLQATPPAPPPPPTTTTTSTTPTTTTPALPKATDGTDIAACLDGTCEVEVRAPLDIPFNPKTGIKKLTVTEVSAEGATVEGVTTTGTNYTIRVFTDPGGLAKGTINNKFTVAALAVDKGVAVLRISPA
jgi:hypothetical protein